MVNMSAYDSTILQLNSVGDWPRQLLYNPSTKVLDKHPCSHSKLSQLHMGIMVFLLLFLTRAYMSPEVWSQ